MSGPHATKHPAPPLLRLPPVLRHRIYRFVGLASWNPDRSPYTFDLRGRDRASEGGWILRERQPSPHMFRGLLLSCRGIHAEAAALLYSANRFMVHYTSPGSLAPLLSLTAPALSSLRSLKIVLNQASCHHRTQSLDDRDCCLDSCSTYTCDQQPYASHHQHQPPLLSPAPGYGSINNSSAVAQVLLSEWRTAASYLSSFITPGGLELGLVCDIDPEHDQAVGLAKSVIAPLRLLPILGSCHIRLGKSPDPRLSQVAQDAVSETCGIAALYLKPTCSRKAGFLALPRELRLRILELTDLVTPNQEVWWCREDPKYAWWDIGGFTDCHDDTFRSPCQFRECWRRKFGDRPAIVGSPIGCFCQLRHAASSTTCTCWVPPGPSLFLVCRAIREDAQLVFFSANRFIIHDFTSLPWSLRNPDRYHSFEDGEFKNVHLTTEYPFQRLTASEFLREVVPTHCIAHLRFLELSFPPYPPPTWPKADHPAMQDWRETVAWLQDKMSGPALALRLVSAGASRYAPDSPYTDAITAAEADTIHQGYLELLDSVKPLAKGPNGLARFYADLRHPWEWTEEAEQRPDHRQWVEARKRELKESAERRVLGDRYDGQYANGRQEPEKSLWQHAFYFHH